MTRAPKISALIVQGRIYLEVVDLADWIVEQKENNPGFEDMYENLATAVLTIGDRIISGAEHRRDMLEESH